MLCNEFKFFITVYIYLIFNDRGRMIKSFVIMLFG